MMYYLFILLNVVEILLKYRILFLTRCPTRAKSLGLSLVYKTTFELKIPNKSPDFLKQMQMQNIPENKSISLRIRYYVLRGKMR